MPLLPSPLKRQFTRAFIGEFIGTFFLVFAIVTSQIHPGQHPFSAGYTLMTQVFTYGYISGGMFNPAVTTGVMLVKARRGELTVAAAFLEWSILVLGQCVAATLGSLASFVLVSEDGFSRGVFFGPMGAAEGMVTGPNIGRAWFAEFLWTFLLVSSVLHTAVSKAYQVPNHFFGLTIGLSVFAGAMTVGQWSGGAFNPAVALGSQLGQCIAVQTCVGLQYIWIYIVACFPAAAGAAFMFRLISCEDLKESEGNELLQH